MDPFFRWLEATAFSVWLRESTSVFAYPTILSAHAIGMGLAAGVNAALALHLLGIAPAIPTREMRRFGPVLWGGFWMNAASGLLLLIAYPTKALTNPIFYLKLALVAGGLWLFTFIDRHLLRERQVPEEWSAKKRRFIGAAALVTWAGAITAGRLLAYTYHRLFVDF